MKKSFQIMICAGVVSSSMIIYYWPDLLMLPCGAVLFVGVVLFAILAIYVPRLSWNMVVVLLFWGLLHTLSIIDRVTHSHDWKGVYQSLIKPINIVPAIIVIGIHLLFQMLFYRLVQGKPGTAINKDENDFEKSQ